MRKLYTLFSLVLLTYSLYAQKTLIHCGTLIDGKSNDALSQMTIVVEGAKITAVEKGFTKPSDSDKLIDLSSKTVMPGFIDMHVHLEGEPAKTRHCKDSHLTTQMLPLSRRSMLKRL